jgi:hypothetical protein
VNGRFSVKCQKREMLFHLELGGFSQTDWKSISEGLVFVCWLVG